MKKICMLALVLLCPSLLAAATDKGRLYNAIETLKHNEVKKYIGRLGTLTPKEKQELVAAAEDVLEQEESRASVLKSPPDLKKLLIGSLSGLFFAGMGCVGYNEMNKPNRDSDAGEKPALVVVTLLSISSFYLAFKGFVCTTAQDRIATAKRIVKEIERASEEKTVVQ